MKILLIASFPRSLLRFRGALIEELLELGVQVHVVAPELTESSDIRKQLEDLGIVSHTMPLRRAGINPFSDFRTIFKLYKLMRAIRPNLILSYTIKPVIYGSLVGWLTRVPRRFALITGLGYSFQDDHNRSVLTSIVEQLYRVALKRTHKVFFQNPDDEALFRDRRIISADVPSCVLNGSGVSVSEFSVCPLPIQPRFLLIARLLGAKGIREYALAARQMRVLNPEAKFSLVGWFDENRDTISRAEVNAWVEEGTIEFLGRLDDVRPAIADSDVYVLPSYYREGTPRTVLEAMAMGRAIITTDAPGCRETVVDGENGFLVPVKSVSALVCAMQKFIDDPELAVRMGKRSREFAEEKYDVKKVNEVILSEMGIN